MTSPTGIILGGGEGTRLSPLTKPLSKQLLPIFDKPMIYYSLSLMVLSGVSTFLIVAREIDIESYKTVIGDGKKWGLTINYVTQNIAAGIPDGIARCSEMIYSEKVIVCLGDNIFHGSGIVDALQKYINNSSLGAKIFLKQVRDPGRFGIANLSDEGNVLSLEEKPVSPKSNYAVTGIYCFDASVFKRCLSLKVSRRGELEVVDLLQSYLDDDDLAIHILGRGVSWLDTGTHQSMLTASNFICALQETSGFMIGSPEEAALRKGLISRDEFLSCLDENSSSDYYSNLRSIVSKF
ncbi:MAG: sugar phosphate nucleotidyltransferase [Paracoccaceae bacterium]